MKRRFPRHSPSDNCTNPAGGILAYLPMDFFFLKLYNAMQKGIFVLPRF